MAKQYNNFSPKLRSFLPKLKPNQKVRFQLNGIHYDKITGKLVCPASYSLPEIDRIFDPWANPILDEKTGKPTGEYEGGYVDIAYIVREVPAPQDSNRDSIVEMGKVVFYRTNAGVIEILGGRKEMEQMLSYLFFSNRNSANIDKEWYIKPTGKHIFSEIQTQKKAENTLKRELLIDQAKALITEMSTEEVTTAASGLFPNTYGGLTPEERVLELRKIAASSPEKIIDLSKNVEVRTTAFIEECLKAGILELDKNKGRFVWPDDKTLICTVKAGSTPHNSLKRFFMTDNGEEVLNQLEKQLALSKKPKKEKTAKAEAV